MNNNAFCRTIFPRIFCMHITAQEKSPPKTAGSQAKPELVPENEAGELAVDIAETAESIFVIAPIAGVDEASIQIEIDDDLLIIKGERAFPPTIPAKASKHAEECFWGMFKRSILLPAAINSADIIAMFNNQILTIEIPKARKATTKSIPLFSQS